MSKAIEKNQDIEAFEKFATKLFERFPECRETLQKTIAAAYNDISFVKAGFEEFMCLAFKRHQRGDEYKQELTKRIDTLKNLEYLIELAQKVFEKQETDHGCL